MKVVGFSFIRNAIKYDYPIIEALKSIIPLCDEIVLVIGDSEDETETIIKSQNFKNLHIIKSTWDDSKRQGGQVLADQCNIALNNLPKDADWAVYIQGDEVMPEIYHENVFAAMQKWKDDIQVQGLLFKYRHFYGSYDYVADSPNWYRNEIRIIKNIPSIYSYRDAQGFRIGSNKKLSVKAVNAYMHHYGWVKHPSSMQSKLKEFNKLWHDDDWIHQNVSKDDLYDFSKVESIQNYTGAHPVVMQDRIKNKNWQIDFSTHSPKMNLSQKLRYTFEKITGIRIGEYKNYKLI
jgi:hypothetical protein